MDNQTRLAKLQEAERLIREVEFSYKTGTPERTGIYKFIASNFSFLGFMGQFIQDLKNTYHKIPSYADHFTISEIKSMVDSSSIMDDDGHGYYATATEETNIPLDLQAIKNGKINEKFTHATWYNK